MCSPPGHCRPTRPSSWDRSGCGPILEPPGRAADLVIVDSPPLQAVTDAAILSSITDGTLFVSTRGGPVVASSTALARRWRRQTLVRWESCSTDCLSGPEAATTYYYDYYGAGSSGGEPSKRGRAPAPYGDKSG